MTSNVTPLARFQQWWQAGERLGMWVSEVMLVAVILVLMGTTSARKLPPAQLASLPSGIKSGNRLGDSHLLPWRNIVFYPHGRHSIRGSQALTVFGDSTALLLALTSIGSVWLYHVSSRHLKRLGGDLVATGLIPGTSPPSHSALDGDLRKGRKAVLMIAALALSILFYWIAEKFFYPKTWWAHVDHIWSIESVDAACWILLGYLGFSVAIIQMVRFLGVVKEIRRLRNESRLSGTGFQYREPWETEAQGWRPLWDLVDLKIWGVVVFLPALVGLYTLFVLRTWSVAILILIAVLVGYVSFQQLSLANLIIGCYQDTVGREIAVLNTSLKSHVLTEQEISYNGRRFGALKEAMSNQSGGGKVWASRIAGLLTFAVGVAGIVLPLFAKV